MNVLYILSSTITSGGASKSFMELIDGLIKKGVIPIVVVPDNKGLYNVLIKKNIRVHIAPIRFSTFPKCKSLRDTALFVPRMSYHFILNKYSAYKILKATKDIRIDLVHSNVSVINTGFHIACHLKVPHIFHFREYGDKDFGLHYVPTHRSFIRNIKSKKSYSICITKDISRHHGLQNYERSEVIYNGIASKDDVHFCKDKDDFFLFAGRVEPAKGVMDLLEGYLDYKENTSKPIPLHIAGSYNKDSMYFKKLKLFIINNNLESNITFLGSRNDILKIMQKAKAIIIPSKSEGFGRCMAEAMFNGCLVIARNTGGLKEQFDNGKEFTGEEIGFRFDTKEELAGHLKRLSNYGTKDYGNLIKNSMETVCRLYSSENNVNKTFEFYKTMIKG